MYPIEVSNGNDDHELRYALRLVLARPHATSTLPWVRRRLFVLVFAAVALASCGGGGSDATDAEDLLDRAFGTDIQSADLRIEAELELEGRAGLDRPLRIEASGPFRGNHGKLPSADLELKIGAEGGGQTVTTGFLSTGDRAFLKFQDVYYEQSRAAVRRANRSLEGSRRRSSLRALGLNPRSWLLAAVDEGEEEVSGVTTRHVSGRLDVEALMRDLNRFARRSGPAVEGAAGGEPPEPLSREDMRELGALVKDPTFDVYVGVEDDAIRRISGRIELDVPESEQSELDELEAGRLVFSVELADVNGDQQIEAPARPRRLSALIGRLGQGGLLGGLAGLAGPDDSETEPPASGTPTPADPNADELGPETEDFRDYADCLEATKPEDTEGLQRCADLLQQP
jgi:hypothetical protein